MEADFGGSYIYIYVYICVQLREENTQVTRNRIVRKTNITVSTESRETLLPVMPVMLAGGERRSTYVYLCVIVFCGSRKISGEDMYSYICIYFRSIYVYIYVL